MPSAAPAPNAALCALADSLLSRVPKKDAVLADPRTGSTRRVQCSRGSVLQSTVKRDPQFRRALERASGLESARACSVSGSSEAQDLLDRLVCAGFLLRVREDPRGKETGHFLVVPDAPRGSARAPAVPGDLAQLPSGADASGAAFARLSEGSFERAETYLWVYEGSTRRQTLLSAAFLVVLVGLFLIKLWPIWLKIALYWVSLTLLVTEVSLIGLRLVLFAAMSAVGFKGVWLFPNLFSEELGIADSFVPLFGTGIDDTEIRRLRRRELRKQKKREEEGAGAAAAAAAGAAAGSAAAAGGADQGDDGAAAAPAADAGSKSGTPGLPQRKGGFHPGWGNAVVLLIAGTAYCWYMGVFSPELVPDFVATHGDLYEYFPAIGAPPEEAEVKNFRVDPKIARENFDAELAEEEEAAAEGQDDPEMPDKTPEPVPEDDDEPEVVEE